MQKEYFLINLDNVIKDNYCEADTHLIGVIDKIPFPILAEKTKIEGIYRDLITQELIYDTYFYPLSFNLHCSGVTKVDARFCEFYLRKLKKDSILKYTNIIEKIKQYTIKVAKIDKQIKKQTEKSKRYINSFIKKTPKKR